MNVGQVESVKLFDRPPSKNVGRGLVETLAVDEEAEVEAVTVFVEASEAVASD